MDSLGQRLRYLRKQKRMNQDEIAELLQKKGKQVVSNWENDRAEPSLSDLRKLAEILGSTTSWLLDGTGPNQVSITNEPPPGYVMLPAEEVIEMQRQLLKQKEAEIERQK